MLQAVYQAEFTPPRVGVKTLNYPHPLPYPYPYPCRPCIRPSLPPPRVADGGWATVRIPFTAFRLVKRAVPVPGALPLPSSTVYQLGLVLSKVALAWLRASRAFEGFRGIGDLGWGFILGTTGFAPSPHKCRSMVRQRLPVSVSRFGISLKCSQMNDKGHVSRSSRSGRISSMSSLRRALSGWR